MEVCSVISFKKWDARKNGLMIKNKKTGVLLYHLSGCSAALLMSVTFLILLF